MMPTIPEIMARIQNAVTPGTAQGVDAVVHIKLTGAEPGEWNAVLKGGRCEVAQGIPRSKPTITLAADSSDFAALSSGSLDGMAAYMQGKVRLTGDTQLAARLFELFRVR